jgi:glycosyltransferase involved in cell wall biosynthesis
MTPQIAISATNPCHVYDLACALHAQNALGAFHSGYPRWKLKPPPGLPLRTHSWRTVITYAARRTPRRFRPADHTLFRWQDDGFDAAVARALRRTDGAFVHALPGQAWRTFESARLLGQKTVLNHASGPPRLQLEALAEEYARVGLPQGKFHGYNAAYREREDHEYQLSDFHCVASHIVRKQLISLGVPDEKIWVVPYGAERRRFCRPPAGAKRDPHRVVFAGQLTQRKGLRVLIEAAALVRQSIPITVGLYGPVLPDILPDLQRYASHTWLSWPGAVSQTELAEVFQKAAVLVLPSWEEAFGLVVPQALNCGLPCIVSDRVGAADVISNHLNGSVFPAGNAVALAEEIAWWIQNPPGMQIPELGWEIPAQQLIALTAHSG